MDNGILTECVDGRDLSLCRKRISEIGEEVEVLQCTGQGQLLFGQSVAQHIQQ